MSQQVNIALNFSANTQQAKTALQDLQTNLTKIAYGTDIKVNPGQMQQASSAAKELAFHLNEAYNATTGNIDLTRLNTSLKSAGASVSTLSSQLLSAGQTGQQAFINLAQSISMAEAPVIRVNSLISRMWTTFGNTMRYQLSASVISGFMQAITGAVDYAQELDKSLNNIRIVTGYSADQMNKFAIEANKAAKTLSTTTTAYTDASLIFYQQGLTGDAVKERADVVVQLANVTGQSAEVVSDQMTAIWNNFADGSKSMEYYADVITKLGAATASSTDEISDGLEKFAAVSETVGLSYEMATAALATVTAETRQSAEVVGTAFKTIFSRMEGLKLGETLEDGTDLNKYSQALATAGVNIKDQNGQLREMDDILFDLGDRWQTLGKDQQVALAQSVAGVRQYNQFIALMSNWDKVQENLDIAKNSTGELGAQAEIYADSWEAAKDRVTASLEKIYTDVFQADFFKDLLNGVSNVVDAFGGFVDGVGGFGNILTGIVGILMTSFANKIPGALNSLRNNFLITFGQGAKIIEQMNAETQEMIRNELELGKSGQQYTLLQRTQLENAGQLSNIKAQYAMQEAKLSDSEKRKYQFEIQGLQLQQQEIEGLASIVQQEKERLQILIKEASINEKILKMSNSSASQASNLRSNIKNKQIEMAKIDANRINPEVDPIGADTQQARYIELEHDIQLLERTLARVEERSNSFNSSMTNLATNLKTQFSTSLQNLNIDETLQQEFTLDTSKLISQLEPFKQAVQNNLKIGDITPLKDQVNLISEIFQQEGGELEIVGNSISNKMNKIYEKLFTGSDIRGANKIIDSLIKDLSNLTIPGSVAQKTLEKLGYSMEELVKSAEKGSQASGKLTEAQQRLQTSIENLDFSHTVKGTEALSAAIGGLSSMFFALQSLTSVVDTIKNPDLSAWEKFLSIGMGLTMAIPMLSSTLRGLGTTSQWLNGVMISQVNVGQALQILTTKDIALEQQHQTLMALGLSKEKAYQAAKAIDIALTFAQGEAEEELTEEQKTGIIIDTLKNNGLLKGIGIKALDTLNIKLQTWAIKQKIKADAGETAGLWAKFAALVANNWIMLAIVAVLGILIGLIALFVMRLQDVERTSPENKLKDLKTAMEDLKSSISETKEEIKNLTDSINNIQSSYDAISKMTSNQQGFTAAVQETNEQVLELLDKYPILYNYLQRDIKTGLLKISKEGFNTILSQQYSKLGSQQLGLNYGRAREGELTLDLYNKPVKMPTGDFVGGNYGDTIKKLSGEESYSAVAQMTNKEIDQAIEKLSELDASILDLNMMYRHGAKNEDKYDKIRADAQTLANAEAQQNVFKANKAVVNDTIYRGTGNSLRSIAEKGNIEEQSKKIHTAAQKAVDNFDNDWNDHTNYKTGDAQWDDIQKVVQSYGANASYVAQRQGEMVLNVNGQEIKLTEEQFKNKLYQAESEAQLNTEIETEKSSIENSLKNAGVSTEILKEMSQIEKSALDNVQFALESTIGTSKGQNLFTDMLNDLPTNQENLDDTTSKMNLMSQSFSSIDWSQGTEAVNAYTERLAELGITISDQNKKSLEEYAAKFRDNAKLQESAASYAKDLNTSMKDQAAEVGLSEEAMDAYVEKLKENTEYQGLSEKQLQKSAIKQKQARTALDELAESWTDIKDAIKENDVMSENYEKGIAALKKAYSSLFDLEVSNEFLTNAENIELMEKALEGNQEAFEELSKLAGQDWLDSLDFSDFTSEIDPNKILNVEGFKSAVSEIETTILGANWTPEIGIDNKSIEALNEYVRAGKVTVDELNGYFGQVHGVQFETEVEYMKPDEAMSASTATTNTAITTNRVERVYDDPERAPESYTETITSSVASLGNAEVNEEGEIGVPVLKVAGDEDDNKGSGKNSGGGKTGGKTGLLAKPKIDVTGGASGRSKSTGNNSGNAKKENKTKKKRSDEIERYHVIDKRIAASSNKLDKLNNEMEKAYDKDRVGLMRQEVDLLNNSLDLENQKLTEIKTNLDNDRKALKAYGAEFDDDGNLINYDEIMNQQLDELDKAVDRYNNSEKDEDDEKALEKAEEKYEKFKKILEQYEETNELHWEQLQTINDKKLEIWQKNNDIILEEMEKRVEAFEKATDALGRQIDYLDKKIEKLEDEDFSQALAASLLGNEMGAALEQATKAQKEYKAALAFWEDIKDGVDKDGKEVSQENIDKAWENVINAADAVDKTTETVEGIQEKIDGLLLSHLEDQAEAFSDVSEELEHYNGVLSNYQNILELLGRHYQDDTLMRQLSQAQVDNAEASIANARAQYELLTSQLEAAKKSGASKETIEELTNQQREAQNNLMDSLSAGLEAVAAKYESDMLIAIKNTEQSLTNGKFYSLEEAQEYYDQQKSIKELYVEEYDKLYQLNKLSRDINKSMSDMDSLLANQKLSGLLDEINEKRESGVEMSQYELDTLQRKYDLRLAEIALEEAQNAKSSMRLMRDSQGNWGYVYTADQNKIDEAQQKYEDAMYNLENSSREYLDEMQEAILSNEQEMLSRIQELRVSDYANYDDYLAAVDEIRQQHAKKNEFYYSQMGVAIDDINEAYGSQVIAFNDLAIAEVKDIESIEEGVKTFNTSVDGLLKVAGESFKTYLENQQDVTEAAGGDLTTLAQDMQTEIGKITTATDGLVEKIPKVKEAASTAFGGVLSAIQALNQQYGSEAQKILEENDKIMESFLGIYAHEAQVGNYLKGYDENLDYSLAMTEHIKNGGQASDAAFIDLIVGRNNKTSDPKYSKWKDNFGGLTQAEAMAVFAIADKNKDAMAWVEAFNAGTQTDAQIAAARKALTENTTAYDYTEAMQAYLLGGGKASDDLFHTLWKNFVDKLDEEYANGKTYKDEYYSNKTLEEIWTQFAVMGAGDSYTAQMPSFATGGYTGRWGPEGKMGILHEKELILNKNQTEELLEAMRYVDSMYKFAETNKISQNLDKELEALKQEYRMAQEEQERQMHKIELERQHAEQRLLEGISALRVSDYANYDEYLQAVNEVRSQYGQIDKNYTRAIDAIENELESTNRQYLRQQEEILNEIDAINSYNSHLNENFANLASGLIDRNVTNAMFGLSIDQNKSIQQPIQQVIQQHVEIMADFPGVQTAIEIEEAFNNIINDAVQYASIYKK